MKKSILLIMALLVIWSLSGAYSQEIKGIDLGKATSFALKEQWAGLNTFLDSIPENDPNAAVLKMLKGHACLAINENDVSFCYILNVMKDSIGLQKWLAYATDLTGKNDKSAVSYYFLGDAQARIKKFDEAIQSFSKAFDLDKNNYLSINARGVTYLIINKHYDAKADFQKAIEIRKDFADAPNNLGNRVLQIMDGADGGIDYFNQAIKINGENSLSFLGIGCLKYVKNIKDNSSFILSTKLSKCFNPFIVINYDSLVVATFGDQNLMLSALISNPGTYISASYKDNNYSNVQNTIKKFADFNFSVNNNGTGDQGKYNNAMSSYRNLSISEQQQVNQFLNQTAVNNPTRSEAYKNAGQRVENTNKYGGWADQAINMGNSIMNYVSAFAGVSANVTTTASTKNPIYGASAQAATTATLNTIKDSWKNNQTITTRQNYTTNREIMNNFSHDKITSGGVSQSFEFSFIEDGKWPFVPCYGLLYNYYLLKK